MIFIEQMLLLIVFQFVFLAGPDGGDSVGCLIFYWQFVIVLLLADPALCRGGGLESSTLQSPPEIRAQINIETLF